MCVCAGDKLDLSVLETWAKNRSTYIRKKQNCWLTLNDLPHHIAQSPEFADIFCMYDTNFQPVGPKTYLLGLTAMFDPRTTGITKIASECRRNMAGMGNWLSMCHDMWTSMTTNGMLGSSIKLTTSTMETYTIAAVL